MRNEVINQKMKLKKKTQTGKGEREKYAKEVRGDRDFRGGNANIWIRSYQREREIKREKRKHKIIEMYFLKLKNKKRRRAKQPQIDRTHMGPKKKKMERLTLIHRAGKVKTTEDNKTKNLESSPSCLNRKSILKSQLHFYSQITRKCNLKKVSLIIALKNIKYSGINLAKDIEDQGNGIKIYLKSTNKWKNTIVVSRKADCHKDVNSSQSDLWIKCNFTKSPTGYFSGTRAKQI